MRYSLSQPLKGPKSLFGVWPTGKASVFVQKIKGSNPFTCKNISSIFIELLTIKQLIIKG